MKGCILFASPREKGNTSQVLSCFTDELNKRRIEFDFFSLYDKKIEACIACRKCQETWTDFGCVHDDDVSEIFNSILKSDFIIIATPIYSWYCTAPLKALLDRLVYGMNKYYGKDKGPALWSGKKMVLVSTCGYPPVKGADLFLEGLKRYAKHSDLEFVGSHIVHDKGYKFDFMTEEKEKEAREFADKVYDVLTSR